MSKPQHVVPTIKLAVDPNYRGQRGPSDGSDSRPFKSHEAAKAHYETVLIPAYGRQDIARGVREYIIGLWHLKVQS